MRLVYMVHLCRHSSAFDNVTSHSYSAGMVNVGHSIVVLLAHRCQIHAAARCAHTALAGNGFDG